MRNNLPRVDWMVGTGLVIVAILSVFYGSAELTSNIASGLIGFLGRTVMMARRGISFIRRCIAASTSSR